MHVKLARVFHANWRVNALKLNYLSKRKKEKSGGIVKREILTAV